MGQRGEAGTGAADGSSELRQPGNPRPRSPSSALGRPGGAGCFQGCHVTVEGGDRGARGRNSRRRNSRNSTGEVRGDPLEENRPVLSPSVSGAVHRPAAQPTLPRAACRRGQHRSHPLGCKGTPALSIKPLVPVPSRSPSCLRGPRVLGSPGSAGSHLGRSAWAEPAPRPDGLSDTTFSPVPQPPASPRLPATSPPTGGDRDSRRQQCVPCGTQSRSGKCRQRKGWGWRQVRKLGAVTSGFPRLRVLR